MVMWRKPASRIFDNLTNHIIGTVCMVAVRIQWKMFVEIFALTSFTPSPVFALHSPNRAFASLAIAAPVSLVMARSSSKSVLLPIIKRTGRSVPPVFLDKHKRVRVVEVIH